MHNKESFLEHRKQQESDHFAKVDVNDPLSSILTVEINTTELCNRTCVFCPRHDPNVYPNRNLNMTQMGALYIAEHLAEINYSGKISFSGYSENLLNPQFIDIVRAFRICLPQATLECNTNGDRITKNSFNDLIRAGLDLLYINLYDGAEQYDVFEKELAECDSAHYRYRAHWSEADHGLFLNNRGGNITWIGDDEDSVEALKGTQCYYPFYKMFVDWNGDVLFCSNDWGKEIVVGNLIQQSVREVWLSKEMMKIRRRLAEGNRDQSPCDKCNVKGTHFGQKSFEILQAYEDSNNRQYETSVIPAISY
jgi:radical SAM protein with 4Fe4S-binding SPASM domain